MLEILRLTLGPLPNNVYLLADTDTKDAVVIDPSYDAKVLLQRATQRGWTLKQIWLTHAHFDHIAGASEIANAFDPPLPVGLHPADGDWYRDGGGASRFGLTIPQPPEPLIWFEHGQHLSIAAGGDHVVAVRHAPGHSPGHVMFYCEPSGVLFCGDVIFRQGIGRTDLTGGDLEILLKSIREEVFSLPNETRLLPGHGPESTVGYEKRHNPFVIN